MEEWSWGPGPQTGGGRRRWEASRQSVGFHGEKAVRPTLSFPLGSASWPSHRGLACSLRSPPCFVSRPLVDTCPPRSCQVHGGLESNAWGAGARKAGHGVTGSSPAEGPEHVAGGTGDAGWSWQALLPCPAFSRPVGILYLRQTRWKLVGLGNREAVGGLEGSSLSWAALGWGWGLGTLPGPSRAGTGGGWVTGQLFPHSAEAGDHQDHGAAHRGCQQWRLRGLRVSWGARPVLEWGG